MLHTQAHNQIRVKMWCFKQSINGTHLQQLLPISLSKTMVQARRAASMCSLL
jgi:hypothetical protein